MATITISAAITDIDLTTATISQINVAMRASIAGAAANPDLVKVAAHVYGCAVIPVSNTKQRILLVYD
jgi:predicted lipoprotein